MMRLADWTDKALDIRYRRCGAPRVEAERKHWLRFPYERVRADLEPIAELERTIRVLSKPHGSEPFSLPILGGREKWPGTPIRMELQNSLLRRRREEQSPPIGPNRRSALLAKEIDRVKWAEAKLKLARLNVAAAAGFRERLDAEEQERKAWQLYKAMMLRRDKLERPEAYRK